MTNSNPAILELPSVDHPDAWEAPILFDEINTPEIPSSLLPDAIGDFAYALAAMTETPESLSVMTVLGVVSACAAKRFKVCPKEGWQEPVNIYTLIALPPANNKSLVLNHSTKPLTEWESEQAIILEPEIKRQRSERKTQEKIIEALRGKASKAKDNFDQRQLIKEIADKEMALIEPQATPALFTTDATPEALAIAAHEQQGRFSVFSDEGGIMEILGGLYSNGAANTDILLKGIDGGEIRVRRKDRSLNVNPYLTIVLTVQPAIIQNMSARRAYAGNGALERFLYVIPQSKLGFRTHDTFPIPEIIKQTYHNLIKSLLNIPKQIIENNETPYLLALSPEALKLWREFQATIEKDLRSDGRLAICQGWGGKICGFTLRIAGLLHIAEHLHYQAIINENTMQNALKIASLLTEHAIVAYGLMGVDQTTQDAKEIFNWIKKRNLLSFTKSEVTLAMRNRKMAVKDRLAKALDLLVDRNLISAPQKLPTRKPTTVFYVNPEALGSET